MKQQDNHRSMEKNGVSSIKKTPSSPKSSSLENTWTHTKVTVRNAIHIWRISNFSFLCEDPSIFLNSTYFSAAVDNDIRWMLQLRSESDTDTATAVQMKLKWYSNCQMEVCAKYRFIIYDDTMNEIKVVSKLHYFTTDCTTITEDMCSRDFIVSADNKILSNDELTVGCEVKYVHTIDTIEGSICDPELMDSQLHRFNNLELMLKNKKLSDVKININGRTFEAHKAILAGASPVFLAMFDNGMRETEQNFINIDDIDEETFEEMLRFIYTGSVKNIEKIAYTLFAAADKYDIDKLKYICQSELCKSLTVENALGVLILADLHGAAKLKEKVIEFMMIEPVDVTKTEYFNLMIDSHCNLLAELIRAHAIK